MKVKTIYVSKQLSKYINFFEENTSSFVRKAIDWFLNKYSFIDDLNEDEMMELINEYREIRYEQANP